MVTPANRPGDGPSGLLPQLKLDDLLAELQTRLSAVLATRDRVHALLEAVVSIESDLDLETVLRRIVEAAAALVDARYAALGVIGEHGGLARFLPVGMTEDEVAAIGHWPKGRGVLGLLIKEPRCLRLDDIGAHPDSSGFPAGHPPMRGFLGVPIRVHDRVFGNLYLAEKAGGEFDEDDESMVAALATAAGVAIENARLYQEARRRERWLEASAEVSTSLLSGTDPDEVLALVARRARRICDAAHGGVTLVRDGELVVEATDGWQAGSMYGRHFGIDEILPGQVFRTGESLAVADALEASRRRHMPLRFPTGPMLMVPLGTGPAARGVLAVANAPGGPVFDDAARRLLEPFAAQAAVALELAERRRDTERLVVLEERDRIAKDLHDTVIQRLFAIAMTLMDAVRLLDRSDVGLRVQRAIDDLDDTVRQIRSTIFALQVEPGDEALRARLHRVIDRAAEGLGFAVGVRLDGLIDTEVDGEVGENLLAVLEEGLSNVVRHAHARRVGVSVDVGDEVVLKITDDGVSVPPDGRRSGLRNMAERAEGLDGTFAVRVPDGGGTELEWRVPPRPGEPTGP